MDVLGDAITRDRRSEKAALSVPALGRQYDYRRFCTNAWKAGNFLRHLGVRNNAAVAIADDPIPEPILTFYGAASLGASVAFGPPEAIDDETRALVVPTAGIGEYSVGPATKRVVYGGRPADPSVSYFERDVWSENPTEPPDSVDPTGTLLVTESAQYSHSEILTAAKTVVDEYGIDSAESVTVAGSFAEVSVVVAGLIAPIIAGAEIVLNTDATDGFIVGGPNSDMERSVLGLV